MNKYLERQNGASPEHSFAIELESRNANPKEIVEVLEQGARKGEADCLYALGSLSLHGKYVDKNSELAVMYFKKATQKKCGLAAFDLAVSYEKGVGVKSDDRKAFKYYFAASTLGVFEALDEVGRCLYWGIGVEKNRALYELVCEIRQLWSD